MSNNDNNLQTQTSSALRNAIMEADGKDRPLILPDATLATPGNDGTSQYLRKKVMETYATILEDTKKWIDAKAEAVQIIFMEINNDIYSTVEDYLNAMEIEKAIERLKQGESINVQDLETNSYCEFRKFTSRDGESLNSYYSWFYKMMNELVRNQCEGTNHQIGQYDNQRAVNIAEARENVAYHKEKMLLCKQEEAEIQLSAEQADWRDDTYDKPKDQELEAHYMYMAKIQEVIPDATDNSGPIFDTERLQKVHDCNDDYNVFANGRQHPEQPKSVNDTCLVEQGDSSDMSNNGGDADQDDLMV
ncbi:hypothetical protein Tco_0300732 [Tanacetum coccineum]